MKKILLFISVCLLVFTAFAGDPVGRNYKFDKAFERAVESNDTITGDERVLALGDKLNTYIKDYPRDWRTYYWRAFSDLKASEALMGDEKSQRLDTATKYLDRAEYLIENNSECQILRAFILFERIRLNPEVNKAKYGKDLEYYKNYAYRSNQSNPRYLLLEGMIALNDTVGKPENVELAKKYFQGASYLYENAEKTKFFADPFWGKERIDIYMSVFGMSNGSGSFDYQIMNELEEDIDEKQISVSEREKEILKKKEEEEQLKKDVKKVEEDIEKLDTELKDEKSGSKWNKDKDSKKSKKEKKKKEKKPKKSKKKG